MSEAKYKDLIDAIDKYVAEHPAGNGETVINATIKVGAEKPAAGTVGGPVWIHIGGGVVIQIR